MRLVRMIRSEPYIQSMPFINIIPVDMLMTYRCSDTRTLPRHIWSSDDFRFPILCREINIKWHISLIPQHLHLYHQLYYRQGRKLTIGCRPCLICSSGSATKLGLQYPEAAATWARDIRQSITASCLATRRNSGCSEISDWKDWNA
jgi:hypothetical protein